MKKEIRIEVVSLDFLKKTYKIPLVIVSVVLFFTAYNRYLVDRSLSNLRLALNGLNNAKTLDEAQKLSSALDFSLYEEAASPELEASAFSNIELAKDILNKPENTAQIEDVKFVLKRLVEQKEKARSPVLVALDNIGRLFAPKATKISRAALEAHAQALTQKLASAPGVEEAQNIYYKLGNIRTQLLQFAEARQAYLKAIETDPASKLAEKAQFNMAWNAKKQGNFDEALAQFSHIAETTSDAKLASFSQYQTADLYRKKGEPEKAVALYQEISESGKDKDLARLAEFKAGYTYLYDLKDYVKAKAVFTESKILSQDKGMAQHIEQATLRGIGLQHRKDAFGLLRQGYEFTSAAKFKEALLKFDKALEADPEDGVLYIGKALGFLWLKERDLAAKAAKEATRLLPQDETVSVNVGYIYLQLGLVDDAIEEYQRFTSKYPSTAKAYYNLGFAYILSGRLNDAMRAFDKTTQIDPRYFLAYNNEGWCLWQFKQYAKAIDAFENAIRIRPDFIDGLFNLAAIYKTIGKLEDAKIKLQAIINVNPMYPKALEYLREVETTLRKQYQIEEKTQEK